MKSQNRKTGTPENMYLWLLLASFVFSLIVCLGALRSNNQKMVQLREAVYAADKSGQGLNEAIYQLREYVYSHMNTSLSSGSNGIKPPLQLKYTYERLLAVEQEKANQAGSSIYTDAQNYCQKLNSTDFSGRNRIPCVQDYVATHNSSAVVSIPPSLYQFDFVSPVWSPDLAGWSLLASIIFGLSTLVVLVIRHFVLKQNQ